MPEIIYDIRAHRAERVARDNRLRPPRNALSAVVASARAGRRLIRRERVPPGAADSDWNGESRAEAAGRLLTGNIDGRAERIGADRRFAQA
jgi:hypothetical protein